MSAETEPTPYEELAGAHDHLSDDDLAAALKDHADVNVLLAMWRRIRGDVAKDTPKDPAAGKGTEPAAS
jgi:hypothetical protein